METISFYHFHERLSITKKEELIFARRAKINSSNPKKTLEI